MRKYLFFLVAICLVGYVFGFFFLAMTQERWVYRVPARDNTTCDIEKDLREYSGTRIYHKNILGSKSAVVFYHGNGNVVCDMAFLMEFLHKQGVSTIFPEYTGYGGDEQKAAHRGVLSDVENVVEYIHGQDYENVYVMGQSIGTGAVGYHAHLADPDGIFLVSPFGKLVDVMSDLLFIYPRFFVHIAADEQFDTVSRIENYRGRVVVVHGTDDVRIRYSRGVELFEALQTDDKEFVSVEGYGHGGFFKNEDVLKVISQFIGS